MRGQCQNSRGARKGRTSNIFERQRNRISEFIGVGQVGEVLAIGFEGEDLLVGEGQDKANKSHPGIWITALPASQQIAG